MRTLASIIPGRRKALGSGGDGAAPENELANPADRKFRDAEMPFLDHLEELRWTLFKGIGGVLVTTIIAAFFSPWILDVLLLGPTKTDFFVYRWVGIDANELVLLNRTITGQFFAHIGSVLAVGAIIGSPIFVYYIWKFIEPGLYPHERKGLRFAAAFATLFFALGIGFGYLVITPFALQFFAHYVISEQIINQFDISRYFSLVTMWSFGAGILFELPVVVYFLSRVGILTPELLRRSRKYSLIIILIVGAFLTPPDPFSQVLVALPLLALYELSIYVSAVVNRNRRKELEKALA